MPGKKLSRRDFLRLSGACIGTVLFAAGCQPVSQAAQPLKTLEELAAATITPTPRPSQTMPPSPTVTPSSTATPQPTATPAYSVGEGGKYTPAQQALIGSEQARVQREALLKWLNGYWIHFSNRPFAENAPDLNFISVFDDPSDPKSAGVLLQAGGEHEGKTFYLPVGDDGQYMMVPPELPEDKTDVPVGYGPLEVSAGDKGLVLAFKDNNWVRVDGKGNVVERINLETKQWETVIQPLPPWAEQYAETDHGAVYEKVGDEEYYSVDRKVTVNGEERQVHIKLVKFDKETKEWVPCYETIESLLTAGQLGTLFALNSIKEPKEAIWYLRDDRDGQAKDLKELEKIFEKFSSQLEGRDNRSDYPTCDSIRSYDDVIKGIDFTLTAGYEVNDKNNIDGIDVKKPHAYVVLRLGDEDRVAIGQLAARYDAMYWLAYDQSVIEAAFSDFGRRTNQYTTDFPRIIKDYLSEDGSEGRKTNCCFREPSGSAKVEVEGLVDVKAAEALAASAYVTDTHEGVHGLFDGNIFWLAGVYRSNEEIDALKNK